MTEGTTITIRVNSTDNREDPKEMAEALVAKLESGKFRLAGSEDAVILVERPGADPSMFMGKDIGTPEPPE